MKKKDKELLKLISKSMKNKEGKGVAGKLLSAAATIKNKLTSGQKNPDWDFKPAEGENHTVLIGPDGLAYRDTFAGPGTRLFNNIKMLQKKWGPSIKDIIKNADSWSPDKAVSLAGLRHDVSYALAGQEVHDGDEEAARKRVQQNDKIFLGDLQGAKKSINKLPAGMLIKIKSDIIPFKQFLDVDKPLSFQEIKLYNEVAEAFGDPVYNPKRVESVKKILEATKEPVRNVTVSNQGINDSTQLDARKKQLEEAALNIKPIEEIQAGGAFSFSDISKGFIRSMNTDKVQTKEDMKPKKNFLPFTPLGMKQLTNTSEQTGNGKFRPLRGSGLKQSKPVNQFSEENINKEVDISGNNLSDAEIVKFIRELKIVALDINPFASRKPIYDRIKAYENFLEKRQGGGCRCQCGGGQYGGTNELEAQYKRLEQRKNNLNLALDRIIDIPRNQRHPAIMEAFRGGPAGDVMDDLRDVESDMVINRRHKNIYDRDVKKVMDRQLPFERGIGNIVRDYMGVLNDVSL